MSRRLAIVMAAGKGTRMKSDLPKVLVPVMGRPMIHYALDALDAAGVDQTVVVVGYCAEQVQAELATRPHIQFALQAEQLGTGHAVMMCRDVLAEHQGPVLVVAGDSPLMQAKSIRRLFEEFEATRPACLLGTGYKDNPTGLGRVVRDAGGKFTGIVEEKDATPAQRKITEVNLSTYVFDAAELLWSLERISNNNSQREYYLTDCPGTLLAAGKTVRALDVLEPCESLSINSPDDLHAVETEMRKLHQG